MVMDLMVQYCSVLEEQKGTIPVRLTSITNENVGGLKLILQDLLEVPFCDITTFLNGEPLEDKMPLEQLHFRENDNVYVEFPGRGDISTIKQLILELKTFVRITAGFKEDVTCLSRKNTVLLNCQAYSKIDRTIIDLSGLFLPWGDSRSTANKRFFLQEGGADLFVDIFKFSTKRVSEDESCSVNDDFAVSTYNSYQLILMILCLRLLWNFGESQADCQLMLSKGVLQLVLEALLLDPNDAMAKTISNANQEAIGCLAGLAENEPAVREVIAKNGLVVRKLMVIINRRHKVTMHYPIFTRQIATSILFFCTLNEYPLKYLVQKGVHYQVMRILQHLMEDVTGELMSRYYSVLFLAKIRASQIKCLLNKDDGAAQTIDCLIERFLRRHKPKEVQNWNEQNSCHWKTLVPCLELMYAGGKYCVCEESLSQIGESRLSYGSSKCDCTNEITEIRTTIPKSQKTKDFFLKHTAYCEAALYEEIDGMMSLSQPKKTCNCLEKLPVAVDMANSRTAWPGSHATQRFGLFTLQCLLPTKENYDVLVQENLLPYILTIGWQFRCSEKLALREALSNINNMNNIWSPPSLRVITSSIFARRDGFQKARC